LLILFCICVFGAVSIYSKTVLRYAWCSPLICSRKWWFLILAPSLGLYQPLRRIKRLLTALTIHHNKSGWSQ
jgi:hypothetical protein